jgi:hypothetical protein
MTSMELLGEIAGTCVLELIAKGETGIRLQETTPFSVEAFLRSIVDSAAHAHVIVAGTRLPKLRAFAEASGFPIKQMTGDLKSEQNGETARTSTARWYSLPLPKRKSWGPFIGSRR